MPRKKVEEKEEKPKKKKKLVKEEIIEEEIEEEQVKEEVEKKTNPALKVFGIVLKTMFYVFIIAFVLVVILQRISGNSFSIFGYRMFNVVSGSMEPKYNIGDVLLSKETAPEDIKIGDAISYEGEKGDFKGKVITHEVVSIYKDENGKYIYKAKGLANLVEDPSITQDQLYGVVVYRSVVLSFIYKIVSTKIGFYACIILPLMYILGSEFINMLLDREDEKRKNKKNKKKKKIVYVEE